MATNNRFKKSIESATDNTQENIIENPTDVALETAIDNTPENTLDNTQTSILPKTSGDILKKVLESGKKDKGSNHTLYLSSDVGEALVKLAKKTKKSKSTLVDEILREILINQ